MPTPNHHHFAAHNANDIALPASSDADKGRRPRFVIVGGGTAGWMTAATLKRRLECDVTVIESARIAPIGVGEATIPSLVDWIENMQIDEDWFLRQTSGTYKLAIRFDNWITSSHRYWHPFGLSGVTVDGVDWIHLWQYARTAGWPGIASSYSDYCLQQQLCCHDRAPRFEWDKPVVANYAYHLDAGKLAVCLRGIALSEGVQHVVGDVIGTAKNGLGELTSVFVDQQLPINADWFIDCSGFAGVLIDQAMQSEWIDWSQQLLCDRAVTIRTSTTETELHPYTISTGLTNGWSWQIPLMNVTGNGYVYSSNHQTRDDAAQELLNQIGLNENIADVREVRFRTGRRRAAWVKNCIAIGLSAGFIEPLESTGIFLVQRAIDDLVEAIENRAIEVERQRFNHKMETLYSEIRDFVMLHYVLSRRTDTQFWRDAANVLQPKSLSRAISHYQCSGQICRDPASCFADANHHFIYAGAGILPVTGSNEQARCLIAQLGDDRVYQLLRDVLAQQTRLRSRLPLHHDLIRHIHSFAANTAA